MTLLPAENAHHFVVVGVVAWVVVPPLLLILAVLIVVLWSEILTVLLAPILLVLGEEFLWAVLCDSFNIVLFLILLDSLNPVCASGFIL